MGYRTACPYKDPKALSVQQAGIDSPWQSRKAPSMFEARLSPPTLREQCEGQLAVTTADWNP